MPSEVLNICYSDERTLNFCYGRQVKTLSNYKEYTRYPNVDMRGQICVIEL
jgi:hypothetical protein